VNRLKLFIISLIVLPICLSLQACNSQSSTISVEQVREGDLQTLKDNMKYVKIDGKCFAVVKYHTYCYDIIIHSCIPCD
jgi:hypothetical protein